MERPKRVKIGPLWFEVKFRDRQWWRDADAFGQCDSVFQTISVYEELSPEHTGSVFVHEVMHALFFVQGVTEKDTNQEKACDIAGYGLTAFWQDNPDAFKWWVSLTQSNNVN